MLSPFGPCGSVERLVPLKQRHVAECPGKALTVFVVVVSVERGSISVSGPQSASAMNVALRPLPVSITLVRTRCPSDRFDNRAARSTVMWTKTSSPPLSSAMKPIPFVSENHFTIPEISTPVSVCGPWTPV